MTPSAQFWDRLAPKYANLAIHDPDAYRETLERTLSYLSPESRVLELGCGTASTALEIAPHVGQITATDIAPKMIEIAGEKLAASQIDNLTLKVAADDDLTGHGQVDAVLAFNLLHLVSNQRVTLNKIHDILNVGGVLISKTACLREKWYLRPLVWGLQMIGKAPHVIIHSMDDLRNAHEAAGFTIVEEIIQAGPVPRLYLVARKN